MATTVIDGDLRVTGGVTVVGTLSGNLPRASLIQDITQPYELKLVDFRVWDAIQTSLPGTASADDIGIGTGTIGTALPYLRSPELNGGAGNGTYYARITFMLPPEYVTGQTITFRFTAGMLLAVAATTATVDVQGYLSADTTLVTGVDLVTTSAQSCNSVTFANYDFTVTPTLLAAGNTLDFRIAMAATSATATSHFLAIASVKLLLGIKG